MIIIDRDIYLVLLGGAIGFLSSIGATAAKYVFDYRLAKANSDRDKVIKDAAELRKKILGDDDPEMKRKLLYGTR